MHGNGEKFPLLDAANAVGNAETVFQTFRRRSFLLLCLAKLALTSAASLFFLQLDLRPRKHRSRSCTCFSDDTETLMIARLSVGTPAYSMPIYDGDLAGATSKLALFEESLSHW